MKQLWLFVLLLISPLHSTTLDEKIGSLFIVGAYSNQADALLEEQTEHPTEYVEKMIRDYYVGGILYKRSWDPISLRHATAYFQSLSDTPLFMMQDQEWGLQMRHVEALRFPKEITLAAIQDEALLFEFGKELARQSRLVGIQSPLSPVADVNSNPDNPIIGDRAFGDNPSWVARCSLKVMQGLQEGGAVPVAKHFPGHGDTSTDSHTNLPTILHTQKELKKIDLYPFQEMIKRGVPCIMSAHIMVPALDETLPCTLSRKVMTDLLQKEMGFTGVIITDDLTMKAIANRYTPEKAAVMSLQAGCDIMLSTQKIPECIHAIKQAVLDGVLSEAEIDKKCAKVKKLKEWIASQAPLQDTDLYSEKARALKRTLYRSAITYLNPTKIENPTCILQIGGSHASLFAKEMQLPVIFLPSDSTRLEQQKVLQKIGAYKTVIVSFQEITQERFRKKIGFWGIQKPTVQFLDLLRQVAARKIFVLFGSPYTASLFQKDDSLLIAYEDDPDAQSGAADVITGKLAPCGKLPIRIMR